jgi:hypothetical protein
MKSDSLNSLAIKNKAAPDLIKFIELNYKSLIKTRKYLA